MPLADPESKRAYMKAYYQRTKERQIEAMRKRYANKRDEILAKTSAKYKADPDKYRPLFRAKGKEWEAKHPGYHAALNRKVYATYKQKLIDAYGGRCYCCGEENSEFLTLDHVFGDGKVEREKFGNRLYRRVAEQGFPKDKYRLACMNCNWVMRKGATCPHQLQDPMSLVSAC